MLTVAEAGVAFGEVDIAVARVDVEAVDAFGAPAGVVFEGEADVVARVDAGADIAFGEADDVARVDAVAVVSFGEADIDMAVATVDAEADDVAVAEVDVALADADFGQSRAMVEVQLLHSGELSQ